jgi:hypothetical protein
MRISNRRNRIMEKTRSARAFESLSGACLFLLVQASHAWQPDSTLTGRWHGKSEIFSSFKKGAYPSHFPEDSIEIDIHIRPDGTVEGRVGGAAFVDCRVQKNRSWFGKWIGIRSDYIITRGFLTGRINAADPEDKRSFTIPFNLVGEGIKGGFMVKKRWTYPEPMFPRMLLTRIRPENEHVTAEPLMESP